VARDLGEQLGIRAAAANVRAAFALAMRPRQMAEGARPPLVVFVEHHIASAAMIDRIRARGWMVAAPASSITETRAEDPGLIRLQGSPSDWTAQLVIPVLA
jgi:hypothetical protein